MIYYKTEGSQTDPSTACAQASSQQQQLLLKLLLPLQLLLAVYMCSDNTRP